MPRCARIKDGYSIFHVMIRSISEIDLFNSDDDKDRFLNTLRRYKKTYDVKIYAYCIMNNHAHLLIDTCGADISKFMHSVNQSYAQYYNRKYKRHGHVFQDRFKSKVVHNERYLFTLSAYIHNNPADIPGYENKAEEYPYSSLGVYLGINKAALDIVNVNLILSHYAKNIRNASKKYIEFTRTIKKEDFFDNEEFKNEPSEYRSERKLLIRNFTHNDVINYVSSVSNISPEQIYIKTSKEAKAFKCVSIALMRGLCNMLIKDICALLGNITQSSVSRLSSNGMRLINTDPKYTNLITDFLSIYNS